MCLPLLWNCWRSSTAVSMEQSPSWEVNMSSASQKIPHVWWNRKVHYHIHEDRNQFLYWARSIQSMSPSHFLEIHFHTIPHPLLSLPHPDPVYTSPLPHTCYMPSPSHSSQFDCRHNIWWVQIIKLLCIWPSRLPCYLVPLRSKYSPQHPILKHPQPTFHPRCERPSYTLIQNTRHNYSCVYFIVCIFYSKLEGQRFCTEW